jgi:HPt (histidine-containing phosphotransfer) domain-containing protein
MDGIEREAEELLRYRAELARRLARAGVHDVTALLDLYHQLRSALAALSAQEIEWARAKAERLIEEVEHLGRQLEGVRQLKDRLRG